MRLHDLVATSRRVAETRSRSAKTAELAGLLRRLSPEEIDPAVSFLTGNLRQGRIGLGPAAVRAAFSGTSPLAEPFLTLAEVDEAFGHMAAVSGAGSTGEHVSIPAGYIAVHVYGGSPR
jgi:DNA ligase-1